uniref:Tryptophan 2,3-dioxygenase n=1 Tax=Strongyloides venezuelensis TaxID=75913 RepID=A0A0K0G128_STRVS
MSSSGCPYFQKIEINEECKKNKVVFEAGIDDEDEAQKGVNRLESAHGALTYSTYLKLDKLLDAQELRSATNEGEVVHDEHLFIIVHQAYELWFKQIIFDIDVIRELLSRSFVDETKTLKIVSYLERIVRILKLLVDQMLILETMSPLDFIEFRSFLTTSSGFQSLQFRLLENKIGIDPRNRVKYNAQHYKNAFDTEDEREKVEKSEQEPSLFVLIERWLERTPGIHPTEKEPGFWAQYEEAVGKYLDHMKSDAETYDKDSEGYKIAMAEYEKTKTSYETILNKEYHEAAVEKRERRFSYNAMKGAMMICLHREMPRFSQPYQILVYLMDIDSLFTKWRYNHLLAVQRMIGNKMGSGGSSGYLYLRSTIADKYKVFLDLFNLSTWIIPRIYIPKPTRGMIESVSTHKTLYSAKFDEQDEESKNL